MTTAVIDEGGKQPAFLSLFRRYVAIAVLVWSAVVGGSLVWNFHLQDEQFAELAHKEAVANFNKDLGFRLWGTKHGGVYVPVTEETPPSPYLAHIPERDIETPSGRRLTLMNPAYMLRQMMDDYSELYGVRGRITGLVVLRPGNAPDEWERQALLRLQGGADEVVADAEIDGEPYYRMMRPMYMEPGCEKCHGHLGFKLGDFRGGVGVSVPLAPYIAARNEGAGTLAISHGAIWLLGLGGIGIGMRQVRGRIEERKRAEEAARESEEKYRSLVELSPDAVFVQQDGIILFANSSAVKLYGADEPEQLVGKETTSLVHPEDRQTLLDRRGALKHGKEKLVLGALRRLRLDGTAFYGESLVSVIPWRGAQATMIVIRDNTERQKASQERRWAQERLRDAVESIADGFVLFDADDRVVMWNQNFADLYPELAKILPEKPTAEEMFRERYRVGAVGDFDVPVDEYVEWRMEMRRKQGGTPAVHRHRDGRWFRTTERPTTDGGIVAISTDITELKTREQELYQAQKMEAVGQLTGGVAHDFNNLLTVILGNLEMLHDDTKENEKQHRFVNSAIHATERGAMLTERLLAFSRKQTLHPKGLDLDELVAGMSDMLQRTLGETIVIETKAADSLWPVFADPAQMESALLNLALNSRDAMPNGGRLTIEAVNIKIDDDYVAAHADVGLGEYVLLSVSDTGTGMSQEDMQHVFEPFFTTKEVGAGSGLGLSMVYGFAQQSGGHVTIYSEEGHGTTVKLYLPRTEQVDLQAEPDLPSVEPRAREETILVVEDDPNVRTLAVALLGDLGYEVLEAGDGASAIAALKSRSRIDLLFTDVVLAGGVSGPEVAEEGKRLQPGMRILFMSGYPREAMIRRGQLNDSAETLAKPFRRADLARKVQSVLQ